MKLNLNQDINWSDTFKALLGNGKICKAQGCFMAVLDKEGKLVPATSKKEYHSHACQSRTHYIKTHPEAEKDNRQMFLSPFPIGTQSYRKTLQKHLTIDTWCPKPVSIAHMNNVWKDAPCDKWICQQCSARKTKAYYKAIASQTIYEDIYGTEYESNYWLNRILAYKAGGKLRTYRLMNQQREVSQSLDGLRIRLTDGHIDIISLRPLGVAEELMITLTELKEVLNYECSIGMLSLS